MRTVTPDPVVRWAAQLAPGDVFVDPATERRHTADRVLVTVLDADGRAVLDGVQDNYLITVEEEPK